MPFQPIQRHVSQSRGDDAPLWCSGFGRLKLALKYHASFQPLLKDCTVHWDIAHQPGMIDMVKAALNIRFQNPLGRGLLGQVSE
ncbi:hypothetical protein CBM2595_A30236 [Cupriavidus taiwanensis]|nr:hypothetical protein CBM2595_A30236 [Cupriavidus taiwanensis]